MAWGAFFGLVTGAYAVYYVLNFLYDLFFSRKQPATADAGVQYDMEALGREEEQGDDLSEAAGADPYADEGEEQHDAEEVGITPAPPLRVEGQGIPLEEFLKEAKSYSSSIF